MDSFVWHILLVDDDEDDYFLTRTLLAESRHSKFSLEWASNYEKGRAALRESTYDAVLVDYDMGAQSGIDLIRQITAEGCTTPMILLTGRGTYDVDLEAMQAGAADYLNKSEINPAFLERSIRYAIERRRSQRELADANSALADVNSALAEANNALSEANAAQAETNRKLAESNEHLQASRQELERRNRHLETLFENVLMGMVLFEPMPPYRVIFHNSIYQQIFPEPFRSQGMRGLALVDFLPSAAENGILQVFDEVASSGVSRTLQAFPYDGMPEGRTWWNWSLSPMVVDGKIQALVNLSVNVTREQIALETVEQERAFLETVLEQMPAGVVIAEAPSGRLILGNRQMETIWRRKFNPVENIREYSVYQGFYLDGRPIQVEDWPVARALRSGETVRGQEVRILRGDGSFGTIMISATPIRSADGKIIAASAVILDITERKRQEEDEQFLIELSEVLNPPGDPEKLLTTITEKVAVHLDAARCLFADIHFASRKAMFHTGCTRQGPPLQGDIKFHQADPRLIESLQAGRTIIVRDSAADSRTQALYANILAPLGLRSFISVPLMRGGVWSALLVLADARPRNWNERQIAFLQTVAERTWAAYETRELVNALRENELRAHQLAEEAQNNLQKLESIIESMSESVLLTDGAGILLRANPAAVGLHGFSSEDEIRRSLGDLFALFEFYTSDGQRIPLEDWPVSRALKGETVINFEMRVLRVDTGKNWVGLYSAIPIHDARGETILILNTISNITQLRQAEQQQRDLDTRLQVQRMLVEQREQERVQIARDLHDGPIQELIGLMFTLKTARQAAGSEELPELLIGAHKEAEKLVGELRGVCNELRPPMLDKFGLAKAIQVHVDDLVTRRSPIEFRLELDSDQSALDKVTRLALYRIYQESINNILRHAQASLVNVRLVISPDIVTLSITDNGKGFTLPSDWLSLAREGHLGLVGIKERAEAIGAVIELTTAPGAGTRIQVTLPRTGK